MEVEGVIEVPGEANPLTEGILYHVLRSAASSDQNQVQTGTKQLQQWETKRGYYPLLQVSSSPSTTFAQTMTANNFTGCLSRQIPPLRSPLPRNHPAQERHRQVLAEDGDQVSYYNYKGELEVDGV